MTALTIIQEVLTEASVQPCLAPVMTLSEVQELLSASRYTGRVIVDYHDGHPRRLEIPRSVLFRVTEG